MSNVLKSQSVIPLFGPQIDPLCYPCYTRFSTLTPKPTKTRTQRNRFPDFNSTLRLLAGQPSLLQWQITLETLG